jgi:hypothetical protein
MYDAINQGIDNYLQEEQDTEETLRLAFLELEPSLFVTDDLVEHMSIVFGEALECEDEMTMKIVTEKMLSALTLEQLVEANIVTTQDVVEQYYNNL